MISKALSVIHHFSPDTRSHTGSGTRADSFTYILLHISQKGPQASPKMPMTP